MRYFNPIQKTKYVGGGRREPEDTKCDLNIQPAGTNAGELIQQWESNELTTIVSDEEIALQSGSVGRHIFIESMGRSVALVTEINNRAVVLTCFGSPEPFDEIASTLNGFEADPSPIYNSEEGFKQYQDFRDWYNHRYAWALDRYRDRPWTTRHPTIVSGEQIHRRGNTRAGRYQM